MVNDAGAKDIGDLVIGDVLEDTRLTLSELSEACSVHAEYIVELVEEGIIDPADTDNSSWTFQGHCLKRVCVVRNLQRDLGINLAGVAVALDLMQEVETLKAQLDRLTRNA